MVPTQVKNERPIKRPLRSAPNDMLHELVRQNRTSTPGRRAPHSGRNENCGSASSLFEKRREQVRQVEDIMAGM